MLMGIRFPPSRPPPPIPGRSGSPPEGGAGGPCGGSSWSAKWTPIDEGLSPYFTKNLVGMQAAVSRARPQACAATLWRVDFRPLFDSRCGVFLSGVRPGHCYTILSAHADRSYI